MKWIVSIVIAALIVSRGAGYDVELVERRASQYNFSRWRGTTRTNYPHRVGTDWDCPDLQLPTNGLSGIKAVLSHDGAWGRIYVSKDDHRLFRIDTSVYDDVERAHRGIIEDFSRMTTTMIFPQVTNDIGDVLFCREFGWGYSSAFFARNNVTVIVWSEVVDCSATNIAKQIDASILRASGVSP